MKNMKKALSLFVIFCMIVALVPASLVSADSADIKNAIMELDNLSEADKQTLVNETWKFVLESANTPGAVTAEKILAQVKANVPAGIIVSDGTPGDGSISEASVMQIIEKVLVYRPLLIEQYNTFKGTGFLSGVKFFLGASSEGEAFTMALTTLKNSNVQLVTKENGKFVAYDPDNTGIGKRIASVFGLNVTGGPLADAVAEIDTYYAQYIDKVNAEIAANNISESDIIAVLNLYNLYKEPEEEPEESEEPTTEPTPTPAPSVGGGPVGGGLASDSTTPSNPIIPGGVEAVAKITDPTAAKAKAAEIITGAAELIKKAEAEGKSTTEIVQAMLEIAQAAMEKLTVQTVKVTMENGTEKAVMTDSEAAQMAAKLDQILATAKELTDAIKKAGAAAKVEAVLTIKVESGKDAKDVKVEFPASLLKAAAEKKIDKVALDSGVSKLVAAPDAIAVGNAKTVSFAAKKMENASLSDGVKKFIGDGQIFNYELTVDGQKVEAFNKPVEVVMPVGLKTGVNAKKVTVFYVDDKGNTENVGGTYEETSGIVKFKTSHFSGYVAKVNEVTFGDLKSVDWAKENIEVMASKGIINGEAAGQFNPEANITRAEFAAMMVRAFKLQDKTAKNTFSDVKDTDWFSSEVASAVNAGLIQGLGDGTFAPNENITRQDMAVIISRVLTSVKGKGLVTDSSKYTGKFKDIGDIASYAKLSVAMTVKYEVVKGMTEDTFVPENQATRAEAAVMMYRVFFLE